MDEIRANIPDEFLTEFNSWVNSITNNVNNIIQYTNKLYIESPKQTKKDFALWVTQHHKEYAQYLFALWDNKGITSIIYKTLLKEA